jgi:hypothetical protein
MNSFPKTRRYIDSIQNIDSADDLDIITKKLLYDINYYEKASQALRRRFVRGADFVNGIDRGGRRTEIKRDKVGGLYHYFVKGVDGDWSKPEERIWVVSMYALWQKNKNL